MEASTNFGDTSLTSTLPVTAFTNTWYQQLVQLNNYWPSSARADRKGASEI
jgi:hypothetical protein